MSAKIRKHLSEADNAPSPSDPVFAGHEVHLVASAKKSLQTAAALAKDMGFSAYILSDAVDGEAREIAKMHAALAVSVKHAMLSFKRPCVLLSDGETTVAIGAEGAGKGCRNH